jgi:hypothetical protein
MTVFRLGKWRLILQSPIRLTKLPVELIANREIFEVNSPATFERAFGKPFGKPY